MKKLIVAAVLAVLGVGSIAADAMANGPGPYCTGPGCAPRRTGIFHKYPMPAFQAAPWYLYWPYDAHFQSAAPLGGQFYAPPYAGGGLVNPYFPAQPAPYAPNPAP